jgi:hypothetical protein
MRALDQVGKTKLALVLKDQSALSRDYWNLQFRSPVGFRSGSEVPVRVVGSDTQNDDVVLVTEPIHA